MKVFTQLILVLLLTATQATGQTTSALKSKTQFAEVPGRKIAYRSIGKGTPIILANRFRGTLDTWDPLFLDKLAENHRVITFDYTGIGYSSGTLPTNATEVAKDIKELAEELNIKQAILIGWSYGGLIAQIAAIEYPELVTHTILLGTGPVGRREVPLEQVFLDTALKPVNDFNDEIILFFEPKSETSKIAAKKSHDRIAKRLDVSKIPSTQEVFNRYFEGGAGVAEDRENYREKLKNTTTPILVISGDHDISFAVENWYPLTRQLASVQLIVLPQTGHGPQHQHPELVSGYIETFLKQMH
jgi:pimeloyl-ACP methyl ester carboxylesterase